MKTCPWCAEEIKDAAVKCPHCQSALQPTAHEGSDKVMVFIDRGFIYFAKFAGATLAIFVAVGAALYGYNINDAYKQAVQAQTSAQVAQVEAQKAQNEANNIALAVQGLLSDVKSAKGKVDQEIVILHQRVIEIVGRDIDLSPGSEDAAGDSLVNLARRAQGIQDNVDGLAKRIAALELAGTATARVGISPEEYYRLAQSLRVQQVSTPAQTESVQSGRQAYDIVFSLCNQNGDQCTERNLDAVEKVIYRLDPQWFSAPAETRSTPSDQFKFDLRVWGVTRVTACIYLRGEDRPVVRSGLMDLHKPQSWGPDAAATPDKCEA